MTSEHMSISLVDLPPRVRDCFEELMADLEAQTKKALENAQLDIVRSKEPGVYSTSFPKECSNCGRRYSNYQQYKRSTHEVKSADSETGVIAEQGRVLDFRNCSCGSTLVVVRPCRRDSSEFGLQCRDYFEVCIEGLLQQTDLPADQLRRFLRMAFREVFNRCLAEAHGCVS